MTTMKEKLESLLMEVIAIEFLSIVLLAICLYQRAYEVVTYIVLWLLSFVIIHRGVYVSRKKPFGFKLILIGFAFSYNLPQLFAVLIDYKFYMKHPSDAFWCFPFYLLFVLINGRVIWGCIKEIRKNRSIGMNTSN